MQFLNSFYHAITSDIFYLALGVTKELSNKRSAPQGWHVTILDLLDICMELKGSGQYIQNCQLRLMCSALPQIPKTGDGLQKRQKKGWLDKMLDKMPNFQMTKFYS